MHLEKDEYVDSCYPDYAKGPGWSNPIIWVVIGKRGTNELRKDTIQPHEMNMEMHILFSPVEAAYQALKETVEYMVLIEEKINEH